MEQFLRTYYTNLNPNATEAEILAFLQSQGFGNTTVAEGITAITPMPIQTGGDGDGAFGGDIGTTAGTPTGTVVINQQFLPRALPSEVARQRFLGFNASEVLVYGPVLKDRAAAVTLLATLPPASPA